MTLLKLLLRRVSALLYRVKVRGLEHYRVAGDRVLVVANHTSFLDAPLLLAWLPGQLTFAIDAQMAERWWLRPFLRSVDTFPMDQVSAYSTRALIRYLRTDRRTVIFPEGRITVTGALMKIYDGTGMVADRSGAVVLPVRIDGAQYTPFSRLRGRVRLRLLPQIRITVLPPRKLDLPDALRGRARRQKAAALMADIMTEMMFVTSPVRRTLFSALLDARAVHGGWHVVVEDVERRPLSYNGLLLRALPLGRWVMRLTEPGEYVGILLPNVVATVVLFFALQAVGRVPAMLNYTVGREGLIAACRTARIRRVFTSRRFIDAAALGDVAQALLEEGVGLVLLEDLRDQMGIGARIGALLSLPFIRPIHRHLAAERGPDDPAALLFTSGSEGTPKGVVLSHANLLANGEQVAARIAFSSQDVILNALPVFHSFGLSAGMLLPVLAGMRTFLYPSPLHYRIVPEVAYEINATALFGTNTFLRGYGRYAHPYDFYSIRYVFAGAEKLQDDTRTLWMDKFGLRILEGYGTTETAPVIAASTPMHYRRGSPGRFMPGIGYRLEPVAGMDEGGRLHVRGPNIMLGYLLADRPGTLVPPASAFGPGWYDTGDIVRVDEDGYLHILGRAKRFAKIAGEMVSLAAAEELAGRRWPGAKHAVVTVPDPRKGEELVLVTTRAGAGRRELVEQAQADGLSELHVPRRIVVTDDLPLLATGKPDYPQVMDRLADS